MAFYCAKIEILARGNKFFADYFTYLGNNQSITMKKSRSQHGITAGGTCLLLGMDESLPISCLRRRHQKS